MALCHIWQLAATFFMSLIALAFGLLLLLLLLLLQGPASCTLDCSPVNHFPATGGVVKRGLVVGGGRWVDRCTTQHICGLVI